MPLKIPLRATGLAMAVVLGATGCAVAPQAPSVLVLPGAQKNHAQFQADHVACQQQAQAAVAPEAQAVNNQAVASVVIGTALGAALGALFSQGGYHYNNSAVAWGAGTGLLFGSAAAGGGSQASSYGLQQRFNAVFMQCMYLRGNQVPGQASQGRVAPAVPPAGYPAPNYPPPNYPPPNFPPPNMAPPSQPPPG